MKDHTEKKIGRMSRLFPEGTEVFVTFSAVRQENKVEVSIPLKKRLLRAEEISTDIFSAIDGVVNALDRQMVKYKKQLKERSRRDQSFKDELMMVDTSFEDAAEEEAAFAEPIVIERMKRIPLKPMDAEEAIMEMEMLGHSFFVFRHQDTFEINVVYKRRQGTYGLISPDDVIDE
jgi:putative sigma-54 modulation protein